MNQLIKIDINEDNEPLVSGRDLHNVLKIKSHYKDWIKRHIEYGYKENTDYVILAQKKAKIGERGRPGIDHALTLNMAKEIAMLQKNEIGRQVRLYFIRFEKEHNTFLSDALAQVLQMPTTKTQLKRNQMLENKGWTNEDINFRQLTAKANTLYRNVLQSHDLNKHQFIELQRIINQAVFGCDAIDIKKAAGVSIHSETRCILPENDMLLSLLFVESNLSRKIKGKDLTYPQIKEIVLNVCEAVKLIEDSSMILSLKDKKQSSLDQYLKPVSGLIQ